MHRTVVSALVSMLGPLALASCSDPFAFAITRVDAGQGTESPEICAASREWLPDTPAVELFEPLPHPETECPFYRAAWQNFLIATAPTGHGGEPAIAAYPIVADIFQSDKPKPAHWSHLGDIKQAGGRQILIDQNGRSIYYGIHVNQAFVDFVGQNSLRGAQAVRDADPKLFFPAGVVEFKSAWQEIDDSSADTDTFITMTTTVPWLHQDAGQILEDRTQPRLVMVRLLALHVVFALPGHPELIWATFEHSRGPPDMSAADSKRDVAPLPPKDQNPSLDDPNNQNDASAIDVGGSILCKTGTPVNAANRGIAESDLTLDESAQRFPGQQTSIYRMFPASKSNTAQPDDAVTSLNFNVQTLFGQARAAGMLSADDKRDYYRLVGAVWLDKPQYFQNDATLENDMTSPFAQRPNFAQDIARKGTDSAYSLLAGEDRLSSTAMESFTQAPDAFPNCFSCHNTQAVTAKGISIDRDSQGTMLLPARLLNVSHVFAQFLLDEGR